MPRHAIHLGTAWERPTPATRAWGRRFGRPAGVGPGDRLLLVCEGVADAAAWFVATLNAAVLPWRVIDGATLESDVTRLIVDRNHLAVPIGPGDAVAEDASAVRVAMPTAWGRLSLVIVSD